MLGSAGWLVGVRERVGSSPWVGAGRLIKSGGGYYFVCGVRSGGGAECRDTRVHSLPEEYRRSTVRRPVGDGFVQVAQGGFTACGLRTDGSVSCWDAWELDPVPVGVVPVGGWGELSAVAVGYGNTVCGLKVDGVVFCVDVRVPSGGEPPEEGFEPWPGERLKRVSMTLGSLCGLALDGSLHCLGRIASDLRQWGSGSGGADRVTEVDETSGWRGSVRGWVRVEGDYAELSVGGELSEEYVCLVRVDGEAECIGSDWFRMDPELGRDYGTVSPPPGPFVDVVARYYTACGLRPGGEVDCFGYRGDDAEPDGVFVSFAK